MAGRAPSMTDSLYSSVLINPTQPPNSLPEPPSTPRLNYPYPLPILALLDLGYTIHHRLISPRYQSNHLLALCIIRVIVLVVVLGTSKRWRSRGGWVGGGSVISLGSIVWEGCKGQLLRGKVGNDSNGDIGIDTTFLIMTGVIAIFEYISFLALLRLSPPSYRLQPFGLRIPHSAIQSPTQFAYSETSASATHQPLSHSRSRSRTYAHGRYDSITSRLRFQEPADLAEEQDSEDDGGRDEEMGFDDSASLSESSISESSIIDLPPALEPNRLLPPSVSLGTGLSLAALDLESSPVIGPLVRRTRSARFDTIRNLGRSASTPGPVPGHGPGVGVGGNGEREASAGYGTFGMS